MITGKREEVQPQLIDNGNILKRVLMGPRNGAPNFVMRVFTLKPGASTPHHSHPWEHEIYVLEGKIEAVSENGNYIVEKDGFIFVEPNEKHQFRNVNDGESVFICVIPKEGGE